MRAFAASVEEVCREAAVRLTLIAYFSLSTLFILLFATAVNLDIVNGALAGAKLFGQTVEMGGRAVDVDKLVLGFESGFSGFLYLLGTFLALFATAHLVPRLQEKGTIDLYLSRPVGRVPLLLSRYFAGIALAAANLTYLIGSLWLIIVWKTHVAHGRFFLAGVSILFAVTLGLGVAVSFFSAILAAHSKISAAMSKQWAATLVDALYWIFPKTAELGRATVAHVGGNSFRALAEMNLFAVYGSTALFLVATLGLACRIFSRKDF